ncbi:MAG: flagellar biosynthesis anti-sigma factor FlgM [Nitrospirae bacterium]|nr:MAG: putative anti-sigma-28 factor, FlgM [Leptospirillum sp. Group IV 'UBA BS']MCL4485614.1 flagellar biosynthesis anti-sigma factor FlgM [Nitrospirota bacterium]
MSDPKVTPSGSARIPDRPEKLSRKAGIGETGSEEKKAPPPVARLVESDVLEISGPARQVARLREEIAKVPDVREERIAELRERIKDGSYSVPASEVAKKMIAWGKNHGGASSGS